MLRQRNGERQNVHELLEVVVYSKLGIPGFTNEFEINFGGMSFIPSIDYKYGEQIVVRIFMESIAVLVLFGVYLKSEGNGTSVVKFDPLRNKQRLILSRILKQTAVSSLSK